MALKSFLALSACTLALAAAATTAQATPYAYASNQITGLTVTNADGTSIDASSATTSVSDSAQYKGSTAAADQDNGVVGNSLSITQAYSGTGTAPTATYSAVGAGNFIGTRSDAAISGGSAASGGVTVSNVAEGYGTALGNSVGTNNAAISFTVTGTGQALEVSFTDLYELIASTAAVTGETANAAIQNNFSITALGSSTPLYSYAASDINQQISSSSGIPSSNQVGPTSEAFSFLTPVLTAGVSYTIALTSTASETIVPGTSSSVPEPASMGVLGAGLVAAGLVRRRRKA